MLRRDLDRLAGREHDLLVVGGGIHGATAAWEAASRGLSVALVEADDFGAGTSWNSLKTIHGGLRHLQRLDVGGLRESARERSALLRIAPELVHPLAFVVPARGHGARGREALAAGLWLADLLTADLRRRGGSALAPSAALSTAQVRARVPGLDGHGLTGGALWWDAQVASSERLLLAFLHAAAAAGAVAANHLEATSLLRHGRRVRGVAVRDTATGRAFEAAGRIVLNAAGPAADALLRTAGIARPAVPHLRAVNLVLRRPLTGDLAVGAPSEGRYLFSVPWRGRSIVGTAYAAESTPPLDLARDFVAEAARALPWTGLRAADVALVHKGRVPGDGRRLVSRSRLVDHEREDGVLGVMTLVPAKYTTARAVAEALVDRALGRLQRPWAPSRTALTPLPEARPLEGTLEERTRTAVREEMALTLADAVLRRLDLGTAGEPSAADVERVAHVMAEDLGWDAARRAAEVEALAAFYGRRRLA